VGVVSICPKKSCLSIANAIICDVICKRLHYGFHSTVNNLSHFFIICTYDLSICNSVNEKAGDVASLIYLWNPLTIVTCLGSCTTPIDNLMVILTIYGACSRKLRASFTLFCKELLISPLCL
jgi:GPI transamidase subunit PIG-U